MENAPSRLRRLAFVAALLGISAHAQDTVRVNAGGPPLWGANVRLTRVFTVGDEDGPAEATFGRVELVSALPDGRFFVYDRQDTVVRRFDASGKFLGRLGRGGDGPGEYRVVAGMEPIGDSLLAIYDPRNSRVVLYAPDGTVRRSFLIAGSTVFGANTFRALPNGTVAIRSVVFTPGASERPTKWIRFRLDGSRIDSTVLPALPPARRSFVTENRSSFGDRASQQLSPSGAFLMAWSAPYRFAVTNAAGRTTLVERPWTAIPLEREERAEWEALARYFEAGVRASAARRGQPANAEPFEIPLRKPAIREILGDATGRVWVEVYVAAKKTQLEPARGTAPRISWREPTTYDVFDESGRYLARVALPDGATIAWIGGDRLWLNMTGRSGENIVAAYRIEGAR